MVDSLSTGLMLGASAAGGLGLLLGHGFRLRSLAGRQRELRSRLDAIEDLMYAHDQVDEPMLDPTRATPFVLLASTGTIVTLESLLARGKPVMLLFTDPGSPTGASLIDTISAWQHDHDSPLTVVVIRSRGADSRSSIAPAAGITYILHQYDDTPVSHAYGVTLTPAVVLMRANGQLAGPPTIGVHGIDTLLQSVAKASSDAQARRDARVVANTPIVGQSAPMVMLDDLDGHEQPVVQPGQSQILLFWSPLCGYCNQLSPDLHHWESTPSPELPSLTLVARATAEQNRSEQFGFRTLLDDDLSASTAFGAIGTPSAVVIDGSGRVASPMARGIREVRDLLRMDAIEGGHRID